MKKTSLLLWIPVLVAILLGSCKPTTDMHPLQVVPAEAAFLATIRVDRLQQKSGVMEYLASMLEEEQGSPVMQKFREILKDNKQLGVALDEIFIFSKDLETIACVARVQNRSKLTRFLKVLVEDSSLTAITEKDGFYQTRFLDGTTYLFFNDNVALLVTSPGETEALAHALLKQSREESILSRPDLDQLAPLDEEISFYANLEALMKREEFAPVASMLPAEYSTLSCGGGFSFPDGEARFTARVLSTDPAVTEKITGPCRPIDASRLDYIPAATMFMAMYNVNEKVMKEASAQIASLQALQASLPVQQRLPIAAFLEVYEHLLSFDGDIVFSLIPGEGLPSVLLYADVTDDRIVGALNKYLTPASIPVIAANTKMGADTYRVTLNLLPINFYYGVKDGKFFFTSNETIYKKIGEKVDNPFSSTPLAKRLPKEAQMYFLFDIPSIVQQLGLLRLTGLPVDTDAIGMLSRFQYIEGYVTDKGTKLTFKVELQDKKQNLLKFITDLAFVGK